MFFVLKSQVKKKTKIILFYISITKIRNTVNVTLVFQNITGGAVSSVEKRLLLHIKGQKI